MFVSTKSVESMKIINPKSSASNGRSNVYIMMGFREPERQRRESGVWVGIAHK
jgi:hypothetical protein